ncbi:hypothetical protein JB92DRAFT_2826652 [Gautieria morchelliformis]|nr:hypothetical protein JB92DRAFT_2826652 [Gautieria morchelliformis]
MIKLWILLPVFMLDVLGGRGADVHIIVSASPAFPLILPLYIGHLKRSSKMLGSFHIDTGAIVAFACMVWIFRKTGCGFLRNSRQQMCRRSSNIHLPNRTDNSMPLTKLQGHNPFCFSKGNVELGVSALPPQSILVNSKQCPSPPSHAYIPGTGPLLSPSLSPYISKNHVKITASDRTMHDGQGVALQPWEASLERIETRISLPVTHSELPNVVPQQRENPSTLPLGKRIAPGSKSSKLRIQTDIQSATYTSMPENLPILVSDVKGSDLKSRILKENSDSSSPLPVSLVDCPDYQSPSTSLAWKRGSTVRTRMAFTKLLTKLQVPSPPPTPMTYPALSRATPIVKEWLSQEVAEDTKTWSDVLSFSEYEREEHIIHAQRFSVANHLPSPPPTPALSFTPPTPSLSTTTGQPETQWPSAMNTSWTREHAYGRANVDIHDTAFRPQAGGGGDSMVAPMSHYRQLPVNMEVGEEGLSKTQDDLPAYDDFGRDYETRLALKRVTSLLAKPVKPVKPTRIFFKEVASVVRPRPPPIDYEPLLLRTVDSSKFKRRAQLPGFKVPPAALRSTSPTTRRERTWFGTKGEVSPHVQVLELLIAHSACLNRIGTLCASHPLSNLYLSSIGVGWTHIPKKVMHEDSPIQPVNARSGSSSVLMLSKQRINPAFLDKRAIDGTQGIGKEGYQRGTPDGHVHEKGL